MTPASLPPDRKVDKPKGPRTPMPDWPPDNPRILIVISMKNEGPYLLEWLSWHKAIGVTDFVVFSNHCVDGTDHMLDRLDAMGELTHLPNPALLYDRRGYQPIALRYAHDLPVFRQADFVISMDADEFINVRVPGHRLTDLFAALPAFDALSMSELNHGANGHTAFSPGWLTETCPGHMTERPRDFRARTGVKTITRFGPKFERVGNHRPYTKDGRQDVVWLDGSGNPAPEFAERDTRNGIDCRGRFDLVSLDHFALRSVDAFLLKHMRGDAVTDGNNVTQKYWRKRNRAEATTSDLAPGAARARTVFQRLSDDKVLMKLHRSAVAHHRRLAAEANQTPELMALRDWIFENAWYDRLPPSK